MTTRKWGAESIVNTNTADNQQEPVITALADGGFVVVWTDRDAVGGDGSVASIKLQRFDAAGGKVGIETLVNTTTAANQVTPDVTTLSDGSFVIVWEDFSAAAGNGIDVRFRRFEADGTAIDPADRLAANVANTQTAPDVSAIDGGGFIIAYDDNSLGNFDIRAQRFDALGNPTGAMTAVATAAIEVEAAVATLTSVTGVQSFVIAWDDQTADAIRLQRFNAAGAALGGVVAVSDAPSNPSRVEIVAL